MGGKETGYELPESVHSERYTDPDIVYMFYAIRSCRCVNGLHHEVDMWR